MEARFLKGRALPFGSEPGICSTAFAPRLCPLLLAEKLTSLLGKEVFLDSDDLRDLRGLLGHVRNSDALVILQSSEVLQRPW